MSFLVPLTTSLTTDDCPWAVPMVMLAVVFAGVFLLRPLQSLDDLDAENLPHSLNDTL